MQRTRRLSLWAFVATGVLATALAGWAEEPQYRTQRFLGLGTLRVPVPATWKATTQAEPGVPIAMVFSPPAGDDFKVLLAAFPPGPGHEDMLVLSALRKSLSHAGQRALAQAVEKQIDIKELERTENPCVYFSLTDRDPRGTYSHLTQAHARIGPLLATLTVLQRSSDARPRELAFEMIRRAKLVQ
jgi:hypothetical protein